MPFSERDRAIVRELASQVAQIAALPVQQQTIEAWKALNRLEPVRPMVTIDQVCWHEMDVDGELTLKSEDPFCQGLERRLRRTLYGWRHMPVDMVVHPWIEVGRAVGGMDFGMRIEEERAVLDPANGVVGHLYLDQLATEDDLEKIRPPEVREDAAATARSLEQTTELLDGLLDVRLQGVLPGFAPWDRISMWRGVEHLLYDLVDRPEFTHQIIGRVTDFMLDMLDQLEEQGLLGSGQSLIHCSGAHTDELPAAGFDPEHSRPLDLWTSGMAQIFSSVGPDMHQEFELDYANRWYERFGLVYYGCCEPLDDKIDIIRNTPKVRKISMSPWVDVEKGAERIGGDFVFSRKPSPAFLAVDDWSAEAVEADLRQTLEACRRHDTPCEFILKDISTVRYEPQRLWEWAEVATKVVDAA